MSEGRARLEPLKTIHEVSVTASFVNALVIEIPVKLANKAQNILKPHFPSDERPPSLHHLRRIVSCKHLPQPFKKTNGIVCRKSATIFLIVADHSTSHDLIKATLSPYVETTDEIARLFMTPVPARPPTTSSQAKSWSEVYWPCIFNPASQTLQEAPPLHLLRVTQAELATHRTREYLDLATTIAQELKASRWGRGVGAVIVDPLKNEVVAVAGDARLWTQPLQDCVSAASSQMLYSSPSSGASDEKVGPGRPEYHALMRAVAMVGQKEIRHRSVDDLGSTIATTQAQVELGGRSLSEVETRYLDAPEVQHDQDFKAPIPSTQTSHRTDTYLCNGLDVYLTHEPCVCCTMAILHSRFRACIFLQRMPATGALCAETEGGGLGYGLFWRKQLNWRTMAFQYVDATAKAVDAESLVETFHA